MKLTRVLLVVGAGIALAGCASNAANMTSAGPDKAWAPNGREAGLWSLKGAPAAGAGPTTPGGARDFSVPANPALAVMPQTPSIDPTRTYGLPELIDIAQRNNPATRTAWEQARQAALAVGMVEATYLPIITASAIGGRQTVQSELPVPVGTERYITTHVQGVTSALAMQWLVFDFGQRAAVADAAKQAAIGANVLFNGAHQQLIFGVTAAYYAYGAAAARLRIAEKTLANAGQISAAADARRANGLATSIETAQAHQLVAQSQLRKVQAEGRLRDAYQNLLAAMGVEATLRVDIDDAANRPLPAASGVPLDAMIRLALSRRPDVIASYAAVAASQAGIKAAQADFLPKVFVAGTVGTGHGNFNVNNLPNVGQQADGAGVLVGAAMPIYDGGLRLAQLEQARSRAAAAQSTFERTRTAAVTEIVTASNGLRTALESNRASGALVSAATTTYDAAFAAYKNGVGTITDVTMAQSGLLDARQAQADAHAAALIGAANLAFTLGALTSSDAGG